MEQLRTMPSESVHCVVTSPPYWGLRDYGVPGQLGLEASPYEYIEKIVTGFKELRRVLRSDGTLWLNMGDSYNGQGARAPNRKANGDFSYRAGGRAIEVGSLKSKDLIGMPWRVAFALQVDGWYLRQDIIWAKPNAMPESVSDRCTKSHEYLFLLSKSEVYFYDAEAIKEPCSTNTHTRGGGINPKAKQSGQHSRMRVDRDPRHTRKDQTPHLGRAIQSGFARATSHGTSVPRIRQNESFSGAISPGLVTHRNKRDVWAIATAPFPEAHFATFPLAIPLTCIQAATSERGCCASCGTPLRRIVERFDTGIRDKFPDGWESQAGHHGSFHHKGREAGKTGQEIWSTRTTGWMQECCRLFNLQPAPCVVLDPFAGAGTTGIAARKLERSFIGIELNPEYAQMAIGRIEAVI